MIVSITAKANAATKSYWKQARINKYGGRVRVFGRNRLHHPRHDDDFSVVDVASLLMTSSSSSSALYEFTPMRALRSLSSVEDEGEVVVEGETAGVGGEAGSTPASALVLLMVSERGFSRKKMSRMTIDMKHTTTPT